MILIRALVMGKQWLGFESNHSVSVIFFSKEKVMRLLKSAIGIPLVLTSFAAGAQSAGVSSGGGGLFDIKTILFLIIPIIIAFWIGKLIAKLLPDDQRRIIVGAVVAVIGAGLAIYGIASVNSAASQIASRMGHYDSGGFIAIGIGVLLAVTGFVALASRVKSARVDQLATTKKCPFCAETIQAEAKLCRYCGKSVEAAPS